MKKKKGFTLVELLAVIVILAVILIIAMPKISDVIKNSKESSLETTAKLIASQAEKKYTENQVLDNSSTIKCSDVVKINNTDYESCNITFDSKGNAKVTIVGKGKFDGMAVCNANKNSASISSDCSTAANYFSYEEAEVVKTTTISSVEVEDVNKCTSYFQPLGITEEQATTLCTGGSITVDGVTASLKGVVTGGMPSTDYE
ncbi:MAG: prepilin-type N-terminal cleavage/methylation domain-containing protein, partial [Tenericutes bacterium]|nr:prepilin-type N-terminal cleavage/methylation domain-containing protein [Mycoplasmatota bacterium]